MLEKDTLIDEEVAVINAHLQNSHGLSKAETGKC